jgi:hypothetical protein
LFLMLIAGSSSPRNRKQRLQDGIPFRARGQSRIAGVRPPHGKAYPRRQSNFKYLDDGHGLSRSAKAHSSKI